MCFFFFFFFKQKTAYEMRISDWSSDVCSSDLGNKIVNRFTADLVATRQALELFVWLRQAIATHHRLDRFAEHFPVMVELLAHLPGIGFALADALERGLVGDQRVRGANTEIAQQIGRAHV